MDEGDRPEKVIFVILTDGYENASREFTRDKVFQMIKEQTDTYDWKFVYLGANQDAIKTGGDLGIGRGSTLSYFANPIGTQCAFKSMSKGMSSHRSSTLSAKDLKSENYFDEADRDAQKKAGVDQE
jgi:hypothetical protein